MSAELFDWTKEELAETIKFAKFLKTNKFEVFEINWEQIAKGKNEQKTNESPKREKGQQNSVRRHFYYVKSIPKFLQLSLPQSLSFIAPRVSSFVCAKIQQAIEKFAKQICKEKGALTPCLSGREKCRAEEWEWH